MDDSQKILEQKINSLYEILIGFMIVDGEVKETEVDEMILGLTKSLDRTDIPAMPTISFDRAIYNIAQDSENFSKNAQFLYLVLNKDELLEIITSIANIIFADDNFSGQEYELFNKLMHAWRLDRKDLIREI